MAALPHTYLSDDIIPLAPFSADDASDPPSRERSMSCRRKPFAMGRGPFQRIGLLYGTVHQPNFELIAAWRRLRRDSIFVTRSHPGH